MKVCIVGWYGTETLGDRAILGGIFRIISNIDRNNCFSLGSIYPFFTERTLLEERDFYNRLSKGSEIYCFDVRNSKRLREEINNADVLMMGGGPLMDLYEMELILASFRYAYKKGKTTVLMGCGVGPLRNPAYVKMLCKITEYSSLIILRDLESKLLLEEMWQKYSTKSKPIHVCSDPAMLGVDLEHKTAEKQDYAVVNLRDTAFAFAEEKSGYIKEQVALNLEKVAEKSEKVLLLSNHTFVLGGDDRSYYNTIMDFLPRNKFLVVSEPLNLNDTYECIAKAKMCVGMRYHAILFQTLLNGNNYIFDYTDKEVGKISGFLHHIENGEFYNNRYLNLYDEVIKVLDFEEMGCYKGISEKDQEDMVRQYVQIWSEI